MGEKGRNLSWGRLEGIEAMPLLGILTGQGSVENGWRSMAQARRKSGHGLCKGTRRRRKGVKTWRTSPMDNQPQDPPHILNSLIHTKTQIQSSEVGNSLVQSQIQMSSHGKERVTKLSKLLFENIKPAFLFINSDLKFNFMVQ